MRHASFPQRHPYWAAVLLVLTTFAVFLASGTVVTVMELPQEFLYIIAFVLLGLVCAALLAKNGWWREAGFRAPYERQLLWLFWLPFVPVAGNLLGGVRPASGGELLIFFIMAALSGIVEETLYRGLVLRALRPTGAWRAALLSAALFGSMHILNVLSISSPEYALLQVGYAAAIGFGYSALVIRTGTLYPLIVAHFLTNFAAFLAGGGAGGSGPVAARELVLAAVYTVLFSAYGVYLLRSHRTTSI